MKPCTGTEEWARASYKFKEVNCNICTYQSEYLRDANCHKCLVDSNHYTYKKLIEIVEVEP